MPDNEQEVTEKNYIKQYIGESGYTYDATNIREQLAQEAYARYEAKEENQNQLKYAEDEYIAAIYPEEKDEYLVDGAVLTCTMATDAIKKYRGKRYKVEGSSKITFLSVTENTKFKCCDLPHATIRDAKKDDNIPPFPCNCTLAPYNDREWEALEADESCLKEGTCKALMNLNEEWDNLPQTEKSECQEIADVPAINMSSILFCRHGGIIKVVSSGQEELYALACITGGGEHAGSLLEEQQKTNARYIYNFFKKLGWSTEAICAVLGNMERESVMNPGAWQYWENEKEGYGLVQWTDEEGNNFLKFASLEAAEASILSESDSHKMMDIQLDFLLRSFHGTNDENAEGVKQRWYEDLAEHSYEKMPLSNDDLKGMTIEEFSRSTADCKDLALIFHASYERSGDDKKILQERVDNAEKWYRYFTEEMGE